MHSLSRVGCCVALAVAVMPAGCGGAGGDRVKVVRLAAASSLAPAFDGCTAHIPQTGVAQEFGGSDQLAAQIRRGINVDMFASANLELPRALAAEGRAGPPVAFATNELVLAVPRRSAIRRLGDLTRARRVRLVMGSATVPVGIYARQVLDGLAPRLRDALNADSAVEQPDAASVIAQLVGRHADAGFLYRTDVRSTHGGLRAIALPRALRPRIVYGVSIVHDSDEARRIVADLLHGLCARTLRAVGFGPPPR